MKWRIIENKWGMFTIERKEWYGLWTPYGPDWDTSEMAEKQLNMLMGPWVKRVIKEVEA